MNSSILVCIRTAHLRPGRVLCPQVAAALCAEEAAAGAGLRRGRVGHAQQALSSRCPALRLHPTMQDPAISMRLPNLPVAKPTCADSSLRGCSASKLRSHPHLQHAALPRQHDSVRLQIVPPLHLHIHRFSCRCCDSGRMLREAGKAKFLPRGQPSRRSSDAALRCPHLETICHCRNTDGIAAPGHLCLGRERRGVR